DGGVVEIGNVFDNGKPQTTTGFPGIVAVAADAMKAGKYALPVCRGNTRAVVFHFENHGAGGAADIDMNFSRTRGVFVGVAEQVGLQGFDGEGVAIDRDSKTFVFVICREFNLLILMFKALVVVGDYRLYQLVQIYRPKSG